MTNSQSFTGFPPLDSTCLTRRLNVVTWITKSKHPSSLLNIMPRETIDPRSSSFSGRSRVHYLFRGVNLFPGLARELRENWLETISNRSVWRKSNLSRGTIHPYPEGCGLLYPMTPRDETRAKDSAFIPTVNDGDFPLRPSQYYKLNRWHPKHWSIPASR